MATSNYSAWQKEAELEAKKYSDQLKLDNQQILDTLTNAKNNALQQLQEQQNNAIYNINTNKSTINANAENNAKQLYINKLLALKSNDSAMKRAGLGSQGIVGSQVNSINNNYGTNLASVLNQKSSDLQNLEKEKNNTLLNYNTSRVDLTNQYDTNYSNALASINDKALAQYNTIYNNYLAMKQQQYENEQAELARQEQIRQFNEQMALQRASMYSSGGGYGGGYGGDYSFNDTVNTPVTNTQRQFGKLVLAAQQKYGTFSNKYQPKGIIYDEGNKSVDYGKVKDSGAKQYINGRLQTVWKTNNGQRWLWDGSIGQYVKIK